MQQRPQTTYPLEKQIDRYSSFCPSSSRLTLPLFPNRHLPRPAHHPSRRFVANAASDDNAQKFFVLSMRQIKDVLRFFLTLFFAKFPPVLLSDYRLSHIDFSVSQSESRSAFQKYFLISEEKEEKKCEEAIVNDAEPAEWQLEIAACAGLKGNERGRLTASAQVEGCGHLDGDALEASIT